MADCHPGLHHGSKCTTNWHATGHKLWLHGHPGSFHMDSPLNCQLIYGVSALGALYGHGNHLWCN